MDSPGGLDRAGQLPSSEIVLTFDDGPDPVWTPAVLDALAQAGMRASFFVNVARACCYPEIVIQALEAGHGLELHCVGHVSHQLLTAEEGEYEARLGLELLRARFGQDLVSRWRPPYGARASWQRDVADRLGLRLTWWSIDSRDYMGADAETMLEAIQPSLRDGSIVLLHDGLGPGAQRDGVGETVRLIELLARAGVRSRSF